MPLSRITSRPTSLRLYDRPSAFLPTVIFYLVIPNRHANVDSQVWML